MKGYRFYLEHENPEKKRAGEHTGNAVAIFNTRMSYGGSPDDHAYDAYSAIYQIEPNSAVERGTVTVGWLKENCKRTSEAKAREVHPRLFSVLDRMGESQ